MTLAESALIITITWSTFKKAGLCIFGLSILCLFLGDLPDHRGAPVANGLRWVVWPLMGIWLIVLLVRALII